MSGSMTTDEKINVLIDILIKLVRFSDLSIGFREETVSKLKRLRTEPPKEGK